MLNKKVANLLLEQAELTEKLKRLKAMTSFKEGVKENRCHSVEFKTDYGAHTHLEKDMAAMLLELALQLVQQRLDEVNRMLKITEEVLSKCELYWEA